MKIDDLSKIPHYGQGNAVFIGSTDYTGVGALLRLLPQWIRLRRLMRQAPGFCSHHLTYRFPYTFGQVAVFETMDHLLRFARNKQHRKLMAWVVEHDGDEGRNATGGFIRLYEAVPGANYANGAYNPDNLAGHEERFTALSKEEQGPPVVPQKRMPPSSE